MVHFLLNRALQNDLGSTGARVISAGKEIGNRVGRRRSVDLPAEESRELQAAGRKQLPLERGPAQGKPQKKILCEDV